MLYTIIRFGFGLALGLSLSSCELAALTKSSSTDGAAQPKTEATVIGVWRSNIPVATTNPPSDIKVTMDVGNDHFITLSFRVATGKPIPYDYLEIAREYGSWTVTEGNLVMIKTTCEYKDQTTGLPTSETTCRTPDQESHDINVKGGAWTIMKDGKPLIFTKR